jgi:hypothetical protein
VVRILSGSQSPRIMEDCTGSKSFVTVQNRALTAIRVAHAQGSVTGTTPRHHGQAGHRPDNRFVGRAGRNGRA